MKTINPADYFAVDYFGARERFRVAARRGGAVLASHPIDARGPNGEALSVDTAYLGANRPKQLLVACSGTHGVECFAGSALQSFLLDNGGSITLSSDTGLLLIHAINPYGFAHLRRTNENNVDLNRNCLKRFPGPPNSGYARINPWLNPESPPRRSDFFLARGLWYLGTLGPAGVKQAIAGGQYEFYRGLFYGGRQPEQSVRVLGEILSADSFSNVQCVIYLDLHTGLGIHGGYKLLVDFPPDSSEYMRLQQWFGTDNVATNHPKTSIAYTVSGLLSRLIEQIFIQARVFPIVLEFGTYSFVRVVRALREENRAHFYADPASRCWRDAKNRLVQTFCPRSPEWRRRFLENGRIVASRAADALATRAS